MSECEREREKNLLLAEVFRSGRHGFRDVGVPLVVSHHEYGRPRISQLWGEKDGQKE